MSAFAETPAAGRPRTVEALLLFGYVLVVLAATFTVVVPELSKEPEATANTAPAATPLAK